jgi:hypothetical protein
MRILKLIFVAMVATATLASAAANNTFFIRNADVYPVTGEEMKGALCLGDGREDYRDRREDRAAERRQDRRGQGVASVSWDDRLGHGTGAGRKFRRCAIGRHGRAGEFMPQLRALVAINPESEHISVVRVNGISERHDVSASIGRGAAVDSVVAGSGSTSRAKPR